MAEPSQVIIVLLSTFLAIVTGFLKNKWKEDPENFNWSKTFRTLLIAFFYGIFRMVFPAEVDIEQFMQLILFDTGWIIIIERVIVASYRAYLHKYLGGLVAELEKLWKL